MPKVLPQGKRSRWQREQAIRLWLSLTVFLLLLGFSLKGFQIIKNSLWDGKSRINFALIGQEVNVVSYNPHEEELIFLIFPKEIRIEVNHGYGDYRLEAVSELEKQEKRLDLLAESLQENLGLPVEGWVKSMVNGRWLMVNEDAKGEVLKEIQRQIVGQGETNLTNWDLVRLWWQVRKVRINRIKVIDLSKKSVLVSSILPDKTQAWEIDKISFDDQIGKLFTEPKIREEKLTIEVLNGTVHLGLAEKAAGLLTNIGGEVVWVGNSDIKYQISNIKYQKDKRNSYTVRKILKIFAAEGEEKEGEGRAAVTLILGEDYWQKLNQK